ncbi:NUDIX hydrolase [Geodermatophilus sp. SYSU D00815]
MAGAPDLTAYPRPSVAVDCAVLVAGGSPGELDVLVHRRHGSHLPDEWALPGTFVHGDDGPGARPRETLAGAVLRCLRDKIGLEGTEPQQLRVFDRPDRDDRGWVLSVAHVVLLRRPAVDAVVRERADDVDLRPADEVRGLPFDHDAIVRLATAHVREQYALRPDPVGLLGHSFTLRELHALHEAVAPEPGPGEVRPSFDTFRRYMLDNALVERAHGNRPSPTGRPAHLYRRSARVRDALGVVGVKPVRPARA